MTVSQRSYPCPCHTTQMISSPSIPADGKRHELCRRRPRSGLPDTRDGARMDRGATDRGLTLRPRLCRCEAGTSHRPCAKSARRFGGAGACALPTLLDGHGTRRPRAAGKRWRGRLGPKPSDDASRRSVQAHHIAAAQPCAAATIESLFHTRITKIIHHPAQRRRRVRFQLVRVRTFVDPRRWQ